MTTTTKPRVHVHAGRCGCGRRWDGTAQAHCAGCHRQFSTASTFDKHRQGDFTCADPGSLTTRTGDPILELGDDGIWRSWSDPAKPKPTFWASA